MCGVTIDFITKYDPVKSVETELFQCFVASKAKKLVESKQIICTVLELAIATYSEGRMKIIGEKMEVLKAIDAIINIRVQHCSKWSTSREKYNGTNVKSYEARLPLCNYSRARVSDCSY
jgi:hypothetical protein